MESDFSFISIFPEPCTVPHIYKHLVNVSVIVYEQMSEWVNEWMELAHENSFSEWLFQINTIALFFSWSQVDVLRVYINWSWPRDGSVGALRFKSRSLEPKPKIFVLQSSAETVSSRTFFKLPHVIPAVSNYRNSRAPTFPVFHCFSPMAMGNSYSPSDCQHG